jgi:predicted RNA binding protein with dsRBD fold (UPF0201 family)
MKKLHITSQVEVKVEVPINPSEDPEKVIAAINNVIYGCQLKTPYDSTRIVGSSFGTASLSIIYEQIRSRSIMSVLRKILLSNCTGQTTWFALNKQAAAAGTVVVAEESQESPLGPIKIKVNCSEMDKLIDWLVPIV